MRPFRNVEEIVAQTKADPSAVVEVVSQAISDLQILGTQLNCISMIEHKFAISSAENLSRKTELQGPLFGVPLAHKNLYMRQDWLCDGGSKTLSTHICNQTATSISSLDHAGAIDCGRLNCVELGLGTTGHNDYSGTPSNPWNPEYICGGSSSGSGAAVAAGIIPASLGTDTGGSIRLPAAACGLVGVKPTYGRIDTTGIIALSPSLDTAGPMARSVRDTALIFDVLTGLNGNSSLMSIEDGIEGLRIGWPSNFFMQGTESSIVTEVERIFELTAACGAKRFDVTVPNIETANALNMIITAVEGASIHEEAIKERHKDFGKQSLSRLLTGSFVHGVDYQKALALRGQTARRVLEQTFSCVDVLITPVWPYEIPTIEESDLGANPSAAEMVFRSGHNTRPINYLGFPAITLPIGLDPKGLPLSVQLVGAPYSEKLLFRIARTLERELEFWKTNSPLISINQSPIIGDA